MPHPSTSPPSDYSTAVQVRVLDQRTLDPSTLPSTLPLTVPLDGFLRRAQVHYAKGKHIRYIAAGPRDGPLLIFVHSWPAIATS
jgi:hypothetical protein